MSNGPGTVDVNSYDAVPYKTWPYPFTHPRHLEAMATLFGMRPADICGCRVLELGCAAGGNLIPQAIDLPDSIFLGIDLSSRQIDEGRATVELLGLGNIELRRADIMDIDDGWGQFDYIISHGVFSWVPPTVQEKLLALSARNLAPGGVAFISYNTYPGWHLGAIVRDLMRYHAAQFERADDQIAQAKGLLQFLVDLSSEREPMGLLLRKELELLQLVNNDSYLFHEHLESNNSPMYFHEFMERAEAVGLQYVGDAEFSTMLLRNMPEKAQAAFQQLPAVRQEQYMDFLRARRFRKTLLCHSDVRLKRRVAPETMKQFHFALAQGVEPVGVDIRDDSACEFTLGAKRLRTGNRMTKAALTYLKEAQPAYVGFRDLHLAALARVGSAQPGGSGDAVVSADTLAQNLLVGYSIDLVEVAVHPPRCATRVSPRPVANPLARLQAAQGNSVTSQLHRTVGLDPLARRLIRRLDGAHERSDLMACVAEAIDAGEVPGVSVSGSPKASGEKTLASILDQTLGRFTEAALLVD